MARKKTQEKPDTPTEKPVKTSSKSAAGRKSLGPAIHGETSSVSNEDIARTAYMLWERRGKPIGSSDEDWYKAEQELSAGNRESKPH